MELGERKDACPSFLSTIAKKVAKGHPRFRKGESPSVDIVISVILIIIITEFAQIGHTLMDSVMIGILFTGLIAFFKVTLDRFYIIPKVWEWGWKRYPREVSPGRLSLKQRPYRLWWQNLSGDKTSRRLLTNYSEQVSNSCQRYE